MQKEQEILRYAMEQDFRDTLENELAERQTSNKKIQITNVQIIGELKDKSKDSSKKLTEFLYQVEKETTEIVEKTGKERTTQSVNIYLGNKCIGGKFREELILDENFKESEPQKSEDIKEMVEDSQNQEKQNELTQDQTDKIKINGIQRVDLNKLVDGKETLGKRLDLEGYSQMVVVYSNEVGEITPGTKKNNTVYSLVGITSDGKGKVLNDEFEIDSSVGISGTREQTKVKANGTATRDNQDISVYRRKSNGASIGCENDQGEIEMYFYEKTREENENVGIQIETSRTPIIQRETRDVMNRNKGIYNKDDVQDEIEEHTEEGCSPKDERDFDGDDSTSTHIHLEDMELESLVQEILNHENEYGEKKIDEVFTSDEVRQKLKREITENEDNLSLSEIIDSVKNEMEQDAENFDREHKI